MAMLLSEAVEAFTSNDVPVAHVRFHGKQAPPYVEAYLNETEHHYADNRNSRTFANYDLVLHVTDRDLVDVTGTKYAFAATASSACIAGCYAIQAGREIRVMVKPEDVSEDEMVLLARDIAKKIESELTYPGQIKVHLLRETKAIEYAK